MPEVNEKLSHWDALHACFCGRWQWQPSPAQSRDGIAYERPGEEGEPPRVFAHRQDPPVERCEVCDYDLTRSPLDNLKAIPAKEWEQGEVVGSCFYIEGQEAVEVIPRDAPIAFRGCNLDNHVLGEGHKLDACTNHRVAVQTDRDDWRCNEAGKPLHPHNLKAAIMQGRNTDPAKLPKRELTVAEHEVEENARMAWLAQVAAAKQAVADPTKPERACACIAKKVAEVDAYTEVKLPMAAIPPDRSCPICNGTGAVVEAVRP